MKGWFGALDADASLAGACGDAGSLHARACASRAWKRKNTNCYRCLRPTPPLFRWWHPATPFTPHCRRCAPFSSIVCLDTPWYSAIPHTPAASAFWHRGTLTLCRLSGDGTRHLARVWLVDMTCAFAQRRKNAPSFSPLRMEGLGMARVDDQTPLRHCARVFRRTTVALRSPRNMTHAVLAFHAPL